MGETVDFNRRKREHKDSIRKCNENSAVFHHLTNNNHAIDISGMKVVKTVNNVEKRRLLESILIHNIDNFNIYKSNYKLDLFSNAIVTKHVNSVSKLLNELKPPP